MSDSSLSVDKERLDLTLPGRKETIPRLRVSCPKEQEPTTQGPTGQMRGNSSFTKSNCCDAQIFNDAKINWLPSEDDREPINTSKTGK